MVLDVEPVTHLHAVTVNRQRFAGQGVDDHERDQLFREMVGAVVVAAVGGEYRQAVGVVVGAYQMVAGGLASAVGAVGLVTVLLGKGRGIRCQGAVDLVGGDVQEAEGFLGLALQAVVVGAGAFQQVKGADDIGLDEVFRAVDGAVHMAFSGKVEDGARLVLGQQTADQLRIADIALHEEVARVVLHCGQGFKVAGVGQLVQVEDGLVVLRQPVENEVAADEAGAACDQDHEISLPPVAGLLAIVLQPGAETFAHFGVLTGQVHRGLEEALFAAAIVTLALIAEREHALTAQQRGDGIGELDFTTHAGLLTGDFGKDAGGEDVAASHGQGAGSLFGRGLFDDGVDIHHLRVDLGAGDDAVLARVFTRHVLHRQDAGTPFVELLHHLRHDGRLAHHQVIGQQYGKRVIAHQLARAQHGVAQAQGAMLAHVDALHVVGLDAAHQLEQLVLAGGLQFRFEFVGGIEMVLDRALGAAGDENHLANTGLIGLLYRVLDQRLVYHRQHFLGAGLGGREESGAEAGDGEDGFT